MVDAAMDISRTVIFHGHRQPSELPPFWLLAENASSQNRNARLPWPAPAKQQPGSLTKREQPLAQTFLKQQLAKLQKTVDTLKASAPSLGAAAAANEAADAQPPSVAPTGKPDFMSVLSAASGLGGRAPGNGHRPPLPKIAQAQEPPLYKMASCLSPKAQSGHLSRGSVPIDTIASVHRSPLGAAAASTARATPSGTASTETLMNGESSAQAHPQSQERRSP